MSTYALLPTEVQEAFEKYAECILQGKQIQKKGSLYDAEFDFETVYATAEDLYLFLKTSLHNPKLLEEVLSHE